MASLNFWSSIWKLDPEFNFGLIYRLVNGDAMPKAKYPEFSQDWQTRMPN